MEKQVSAFTSMFGMLAQAAQPSPSGSMLSSFLIFIPLIGIMYFLMIRPQQKKQKEHDQMLTQIKTGDKVMTTSGIYATVFKVTDKNVTLEIAPKVYVDFVNAAIADIIKDDAAASNTANK